MAGDMDYEVVCRECDYRHLVTQQQVYRVVRDGNQTGHKLAVSAIDE